MMDTILGAACIAFLVLLEPAVMLYARRVARKRGWLWTGH